MSAIIDAILGRLPDVEPIAFSSGVHTPNSDRTLQTTRHTIGVDGTLTGLEVVAVAGSPQMDLYVKATLEDDQQIERSTLFRGYIDGSSTPNGNGAIPVKTTWKLKLESWGYVSNVNLVLRGTMLSKKRQAGGWNGTNQTSTSASKLRQIIGSTPSQGNEILESVPSGARWSLLMIKIRLVASSTSASRVVDLFFNSVGGSNTYMAIPSGYNQTTNQDNGMTYKHWGLDSTSIRDANNLRMNLPTNVILLAGEQFTTATASIQADDQFDAVLFTVLDSIEV